MIVGWKKRLQTVLRVLGRRERQSAGPVSLDAFRKRPPPPPPPRSSSLGPSLTPTTGSRDDIVQAERRWGSSWPCSGSQQQSTRPGERMQDRTESTVGKAYLETDIDSVRREDELKDIKTTKERTLSKLERQRTMALGGKAAPPEFWQGTFGWMRSPSLALRDEGLGVRSHYRSYSLPRGINMVPDEEMNTISSLQEQKEDLRKRLSYTTHKLELLESEFDSTRQYLETELRRAQEELDKFTDKLRRIQSSYSALQRINQDLEDKIQRNSQHHDDEKRALSREIIVLNNHLMEAKLTIEKLREDNDLYRKDCNLAAQLLQCNKSHYRTQLSELPAEFQERVSMHMEGTPLCHTAYADSVPASVIAKVLEKPDEACSGSQASSSPTPQAQDQGFLLDTLDRGAHLGLRAAYKSDLYSSDTALYCPVDQNRERRPSMDLHGQRKLIYGPQNSMDSNPEEGPLLGLRSGFSQECFAKFPTTLGPASGSSYSSFSGGGSDDNKGDGPPSSTASSPHHHSLYMDWRDGGDYERKSDSSWERDSPGGGGFAKVHAVFQQAGEHGGAHHQNGSSPVYSRTMSSCFSEPYEPLPPSSSPSVAYGDSRRGSTLAPEEEELIGRWRQLSVEDLSAHSYHSPGRASPYSFSEQHFSVRPAKIRLGPLYSSFQEGADYYHQGPIMEPPVGFSTPSPECSPGGGLRQAHQSHSQQAHQTHLYRAKEDSQDSENSPYHSGNTKEGSVGGAGGGVGAGQNKEYVDVSPNSSTESLNQRSLQMAAEMQQHYQAEMQPPSPPQGSPPPPPPAPCPPPPQYQQFGTLGLSRKDSLTKAQLYGTLLN
ncbi:brain-enriched guanylate kinase-associated protein isoform X2 [Esox lucius]|uniref:brain-enriched guanylate kinase-associated protein isoform X2 n=1 Tax=Esox lucius TaxID=8010 RepID=UPI001476B667|nr:brain-enriched guanylate kinase-associated protein isoform X2 [Esox lucius]